MTNIMPQERKQTKGKRRVPVTVPKKQTRRPKEKKPEPRKPKGKVPLTPIEEDERELAALEERVKAAKTISPSRLLLEKFLQAYLQTLDISLAAKALLPIDKRKDKGLCADLGRRYWRSRAFQRLLDEHLEEFGRKTKRLKRVTLLVLEKAMVEDSGIGGHGARVKAADTMSKILGMQEKTVNHKGSGVSNNLLVVPGVASLDDWEAAAEKAQDELKRRTRAAHESVEAQQEELEDE